MKITDTFEIKTGDFLVFDFQKETVAYKPKDSEYYTVKTYGRNDFKAMIREFLEHTQNLYHCEVVGAGTDLTEVSIGDIFSHKEEQ